MMTSQPMAASVCVDYLSHPLSAEHLLVCYQQITRQIAYAPQSAKDAAISYQHQSQTLLTLLAQHQHQNLAVPRERLAPVGCQSQLRRMQNALWRRSSQSSLAKDVALVRPESLNWQKECDVLWLYGPLYDLDLDSDTSTHSSTLETLLPSTQPNDSTTAIDTSETPLRITIYPSTPNGDLPSTTPSSTATTVLTPSIQSTAAVECSNITLLTSSPITSTSQDPQPVADPSVTSLTRPQKSVLKQQGTRMQLFEDLRSFMQSPHYLALTQALRTCPPLDGSCSEPTSPFPHGNTSPSYILPIFPSPSKHHFRSHDRRRASFPKSASHPSRLSGGLVSGSKQLRFSLEVQELIFLPTSPPFRISRAKPTRAHSDPAIQITSSPSSSYLAPSRPLSFPESSLPSTPPYHSSLISTAAVLPDHTTTFIKISPQESRSMNQYRSLILPQPFEGTLPEQAEGDDDDPEDETGELGQQGLYMRHRPSAYSFQHGFYDEFLPEDCEEYSKDETDKASNGGKGDNSPEDERFIQETRVNSSSGKSSAVIRRGGEMHPRAAAPGMLWQVYTAVTGVKELIAWYGSMVYHSSSL